MGDPPWKWNKRTAMSPPAIVGSLTLSSVGERETGECPPSYEDGRDGRDCFFLRGAAGEERLSRRVPLKPLLLRPPGKSFLPLLLSAHFPLLISLYLFFFFSGDSASEDSIPPFPRSRRSKATQGYSLGKPPSIPPLLAGLLLR